jgi:hypothetical protein
MARRCGRHREMFGPDRLSGPIVRRRTSVWRPGLGGKITARGRTWLPCGLSEGEKDARRPGGSAGGGFPERSAR